MNNTVIFSEKQADICTKKMINYFSNSSLYAEVEYPSSLRKNSEDYFIYMFYSCLLDYGMRSKLYHANLIKTYEQYPNIFLPEYVIKNYRDKPQELLEIMKNSIHPRYPNVALEKWITLSEYLANEDNLIERLSSFRTYDELAFYIRNIKGYGQKTGGLLIRIIYDSGIFKNKIELKNIPIDRHDIEISYLNNVVNISDLSENDIDFLGLLWVKVAKSNFLNPSLMDKYLWTIGNNFCNKKNCLECPLKDTCRRGRNENNNSMW